LAAVAQTFTLSTPPLIAGSWFGATERATATALGVLANQMGTALGMGITILADFSLSTTTKSNTHTHTLIDENMLKVYLGVQLLVATIAFILVATFVADEPPTPPSTATLLIRYAKSKIDEAKTERQIQLSTDDIHGDVPNEKTSLNTCIITSQTLYCYRAKPEHCVHELLSIGQ
jgi:sugar phosphate permease